MPITGSIGGQKVEIYAGPQLRNLGAKTVAADGTEQTLVEQPGGSPSQVLGYIDLANMVDGDTIILRFYAKVKADGQWRAAYEDTYSGLQFPPLVHVVKRPENHGLKVTLRQTAGSYKGFDYEFFEEA